MTDEPRDYHCRGCDRNVAEPVRMPNLGLLCPLCRSGRIRHQHYPIQR